MATIKCPQCGGEILVTHRTGRPRQNIDVFFVLNTVRACGSVRAAAEKIGCNRMTIYNRLREGGYDVRELVKK